MSGAEILDKVSLRGHVPPNPDSLATRTCTGSNMEGSRVDTATRARNLRSFLISRNGRGRAVGAATSWSRRHLAHPVGAFVSPGWLVPAHERGTAKRRGVRRRRATLAWAETSTPTPGA